MPNFWSVVNGVYLQADAATKQAIIAVGGIGAVVNTIIAVWAVLQSLTRISDKVRLLVQRLTQGRHLTNSARAKLESAADKIIRNL